MSMSRIVADWLMRWTTRRPPPRRADWVLAMQREYDTLERGQLGWALGCFAAVTGWKLRTGWHYVLLLCLAPVLIALVSMIPFELLRWELVSRASYMSFERSSGPFVAMLSPLPLAFILGAIRPHGIGTTILGGLLAQHLGGTLLTMYMLGGPFFSWWSSAATLYMAPPLVGLSASLGVWCVGVAAGVRWARGRPGAAAMGLAS